MKHHWHEFHARAKLDYDKNLEKIDHVCVDFCIIQ